MNRVGAFNVDKVSVRRWGWTGHSRLPAPPAVRETASQAYAGGPGEPQCGRGVEVLDVGRRSRTVPLALRRALEVQDRGLPVPGLWATLSRSPPDHPLGGRGDTSLQNTLLLCRRRHRLLHEEGWTVESWGRGRPCFTDLHGSHHLDAEDGRRRSSPTIPSGTWCANTAAGVSIPDPGIPAHAGSGGGTSRATSCSPPSKLSSQPTRAGRVMVRRKRSRESPPKERVAGIEAREVARRRCDESSYLA